MRTEKVELVRLTKDDREQFIKDNQWSFKYGAIEEFGPRDNHLDNDGEIISRKTIEESIDCPENETYRIMLDGKKVGGVVVKIDKKTNYNHLDLLFVLPEEHSKGIGLSAWRAVEKLYPQTKVWETFTPYFEKRNIHFYINKCGFSAVEFFCECHSDPNECDCDDSEGPSEMLRFIKIMK